MIFWVGTVGVIAIALHYIFIYLVKRIFFIKNLNSPPHKKGRGRKNHSRRIIKSASVALSHTESNWGGGDLGFFVLL